MTKPYRLYHDEIPLTCEDLYGTIAFEYYSFEAEQESTPLLQIKLYSQTRPPMKNAPPELAYGIYIPKFSFIKDIVISDLTKINTWSDKKIEALDNNIFSTESAYTFYYEGADENYFTGEYVLVFDDQIVHIVAETSLTAKQIEIVKSKLQIGH